jgi:Putative peptidoglycan binding domain
MGKRWARWAVLGTLVVLPPLPLISPAQGSSGGSGIAPKHKRAHKTQAGPFNGRGMWIWYVSASNGGNVNSIIATAHRYGVSVLMIKSGDGTGTWSQFSTGLVSALHRAGLRVCGWQYVYGSHPAAEAHVGAWAQRQGADCLLIDAESEYEGKYVSAQTYISNLRKAVGPSFPIALASFPYVDYHPSLPYSVFMGPGGAQYNVPQMYWVDIGVSTDVVYAHTYVFNRPYGRAIAPLGQVYNNPPASQIRRFRALSRAYGAHGVSWWDWQESPRYAWKAISQPVGNPSNFSPDQAYASLASGAQGDLVVWAQEHLYAAGYHLTLDGSYGSQTKRAVRSFQSAHGLAVDGVIGTMTWHALLQYAPVAVHWTSSGATAARAASDGGIQARVPKSASLRAKRYEIPRSLGRG